MVSRALSAFVAAAMLLSHAPARAQNAEAVVHVRTPGVTLELRPNGEKPWQTGCNAPCDVRVPVFYEYRIAGRDVQPSKPFRIEAPKVEITADPGSRGLHTAGLATDIVGGLAIIGAFFYVIIGTIEDESNGEDAGRAFKDRATGAVGLSLLLGGIALSITGSILQAVSDTEVKQRPLGPIVKPAPAAARTPSFRDASAIDRVLPAPTTAPIVSFAF